MDQDINSLNKGVFVIPFRPEAADAGPSRPRPLDDVYTATSERYAAAAQAFEDARTAEQLDDVADWLARCAAPRLLRNTLGIHRVPVGIIQGISLSLPPLLPTLLAHALTLPASTAPDLAAATRAIAVGFVGEATGRTGMDEVERWHEKLRGRPPLLLHIEQAQLMPPSLLAELTYILALHPAVPVRLLLSVPSTATFLSTWTHIEPSSIDLSVLGSGRPRRRAGAVSAILKTATDAAKVPLTISDELADEIKREDELLGGGAPAALKALKWALLRHSYTSPLAALGESDDDTMPGKLQTVVDGVKADPHGAPGRELLVVQASKDLTSTQNPAPRMSILHALAQPADFVAGAGAPAAEQVDRMDVDQPDTAVDGTDHISSNAVSPTTDFKELETLFAMWKGAGKTINLWDWLEGFRQAMRPEDEDGEAADAGDPGAAGDGGASEDGVNGGAAGAEAAAGRKRKRARPDGESGPDTGREDGKEVDDDDGQGEAGDGARGRTERDEDEEARLHAVFVRFVEEARMLGLVRARGRGAGRRGDEVVKAVGLA